MITKEEYNQLKKQHEEACKRNDHSRMILIGSETYKKMKEFDSHRCKHNRVISHQGGQVDECLDCGKTWG